LVRLLSATLECEASGAIAKCGRDIRLFTKYSSRPIQHLLLIPNTKVRDHVSHIPVPDEVQWAEPVSSLRVINRFFDLTEISVQDRPDTERHVDVGFKSNGLLDESCTGTHIPAGHCKNVGCSRHYVRVVCVESNRFLS